MKTLYTPYYYINGDLIAYRNKQIQHSEKLVPVNVQDLNRDSMKLKITIGEAILPATLIKSKTKDDFVRLLPLNLIMNDLFGEKYGELSTRISTEGKRSFNYEVGDIGYWSPGHDLAIYYKNDGESIPNPGIVIVGKIESGTKAFNVPGSVKLKIKRAD